MRILLVMGDQRLLDALEAAFRFRWPHAELLVATEFTTVLSLAIERAPAVIVLDADLPDRSGFDVLADIRRASDVPVVLLTGGDRRLDGPRAKAAGADLHLPKPFSTEALLRFISQVGAVDRRESAWGNRRRASGLALVTLLSAAAVVGAVVWPVALSDPASHERLRHTLICELPPDLMADRFEDLGWCERDDSNSSSNEGAQAK